MAISPSSSDRRYQERAAELLQTIRGKTGSDRRTFERVLADAAGRLMRRGTEGDTAVAVYLLNSAGFSVAQNDQGGLVGRRHAPAGPPIGSGNGNGNSNGGNGPGANTGISPRGRDPRAGGGQQYDETWSRGTHEQARAESREVVFTPGSSNVYSFTYNREAAQRLGTLFVTYKAHVVNPHSVSTSQNRSGWTDMTGRSGKTVGGKLNAPGATYAYHGVPPSLFAQMKAAGSKGGFIWDKIRKRGSVHEHQYRYTLVTGQISEASGGPRYYIPRRATKFGFRSRAQADPTQRDGRRGYNTSTLPEQAFTYRSRDRRN